MKTVNGFKTLLMIAVAGLALGCSEKTPQGSASGGGGYVWKNSKKFLERTQENLAGRLRLMHPTRFKEFPGGWDGEKMAQLVERAVLQPNKQMKRDGVDLMFNYIDEPGNQHIEVLKPYFIAYASKPILAKNETGLTADMVELENAIMHEIAHIVLNHKHALATGSTSEEIEAEADQFALNLLMNSFIGQIFCKPGTSTLEDNSDFAKNIFKADDPIWRDNSLMVMSKSYYNDYSDESSDDLAWIIRYFDYADDTLEILPTFEEVKERPQVYASFFRGYQFDLDQEVVKGHRFELSEQEKYVNDLVGRSYYELGQIRRVDENTIRLTGARSFFEDERTTDVSFNGYSDGQTEYIVKRSDVNFELKRNENGLTAGRVGYTLSSAKVVSGTEYEEAYKSNSKIQFSNDFKVSLKLDCIESDQTPIRLGDPRNNIWFTDIQKAANELENEFRDKLYESQNQNETPAIEINHRHYSNVGLDYYKLQACYETAILSSDIADEQNDNYIQCVDEFRPTNEDVLSAYAPYKDDDRFDADVSRGCFEENKFVSRSAFKDCINTRQPAAHLIAYNAAQKALVRKAFLKGVDKARYMERCVEEFDESTIGIMNVYFKRQLKRSEDCMTVQSALKKISNDLVNKYLVLLDPDQHQTLRTIQANHPYYPIGIVTKLKQELECEADSDEPICQQLNQSEQETFALQNDMQVH